MLAPHSPSGGLRGNSPGLHAALADYAPNLCVEQVQLIQVRFAAVFAEVVLGLGHPLFDFAYPAVHLFQPLAKE
jgi:hypothetical protein